MSTRYIGGLVYNPPGGWSGLFNGSSQYLSVANNAAFNLNGVSFTVECFVYWNSVTGEQNIAEQFTGPSGPGWTLYKFNSSTGSPAGSIDFYGGGGSINSGVVPVAGLWYHLAISRNNSTGTTSFYVNGVRTSTATFGVGSSASTALLVGVRNGGSTYFNGYISNLRIVRNAYVYDPTLTSITVPTGALLPVTNTSFLTCRYPTFVDGSTNAFTITNNGTATVSTSNPFPTSVLPNPALGGAGNGIYTLSQYASLLGAGTWPAYDPYYENVTLNLHGNAGAVLPFNTDASTNNFQVTQVGDTRPSNYTPFITNGYWSNYFDGSGDRLVVPANAAFNFSTGDFTVECWVYLNSVSANQWIIGPDNTVTYPWVLQTTGTAIRFISNNASNDFRPTSFTLTTGTWNHFAVTRSGSTMYWFTNGTLNGTQTYSTAIGSNTIDVQIGTTGSGSGDPVNGYISNLRVVKGTAVYTSSFTPSTTPLTAISGTSLLTCQSNRFIDNSANAFTITPSGNTAVNPFQPFTAPTGTSAYGSGYFDGSGDWLSSPNVAFASNNFTVEGWFYTSSIASTTNYWGQDNGSGVTPKFILYVNGSGNFQVETGSIGGAVISVSAATYLRTNSWQHIAVVRGGTGANQLALFIDGVRVGIGTLGSLSSITQPFYIGYIGESYGISYSGYVSNFRIVNGTDVYGYTNSTITVPTSPLTAITNTSLLTVQTNAPSQNNTFLDSSTNNFTVTRNGNTTQGTFTPYGSNWSNYFNGTDAYWKQASSANYILGTNDFTLECWINLNSTSTTMRRLFGVGYGANGGSHGCSWEIRYYGTESPVGQIALSRYDGSTSTEYSTSGATIVVGQWYHIAVSRTGGNLRIFVNGTAYYNAANTFNFTQVTYGGNTELWTGLGYYGPAGGLGGPRYFGGYMSNIRIINGTGIYSSNFTPSTTPLTAVTNTQLLSAQSNRFVDNSTNAQAITTGGSPSVQRFSPFAPPAYYQPSVIGGSGYFDGSSDCLNAPDSSAFDFGSGDFTVEGWMYPTATGSYLGFFCKRSVNSSYSPVAILTNSGTMQLFASTSGSSWAVAATASTNPVLNTWNHVAAVRSGSTYTMYLNGVSVASGSLGTSALMTNTAPFTIGADAANATGGFAGYISNMRVVKGTAVYTSAFTPPTAPLTAVTNTQLLCNFTNAGILDNAMMNDLETVTTAQLSTNVKKYGSASMYFSGSTDRLQIPITPQIYLGTTYTIEAWVYATNLTGYRPFFSITEPFTGGFANLDIMLYGSSQIAVEIRTATSGSITTIQTSAISANTWYHVALSVNAGSARLFLNGVQAGSTTTFAEYPIAKTSFAAIGGYGHGWVDNGIPAGGWIGYIDDLRITKGVARYTANFTPPTSQLQDQ